MAEEALSSEETSAQLLFDSNLEIDELPPDAQGGEEKKNAVDDDFVLDEVVSQCRFSLWVREVRASGVVSLRCSFAPMPLQARFQHIRVTLVVVDPKKAKIMDLEPKEVAEPYKIARARSMSVGIEKIIKVGGELSASSDHVAKHNIVRGVGAKTKTVHWDFTENPNLGRGVDGDYDVAIQLPGPGAYSLKLVAKFKIAKTGIIAIAGRTLGLRTAIAKTSDLRFVIPEPEPDSEPDSEPEPSHEAAPPPSTWLEGLLPSFLGSPGTT